MRILGKKIVAAVGVVATAGVALAGCSSSGEGSASSAEKITLTFANADPSATWAKAVSGFEKKNPNITVKQLNVPYARYTSTINQRMAQNGDGLDLLVVDAGGSIADFANRGFLADLSTMKKDAIKAAVSPDMVTAREVNGKLYAIETWTGSQFLYYNKDLLAKAGVTPPPSDPSEPWTYAQLADAAEKVKVAGAARDPFLFGQWDTYFQMQPLGVSAGGGNGISTAGKADFSNDGWQKALTWYHDLFSKGLSPRGITSDKNGGLFQTGEAALMVSGPQMLAVSVEGKLNFGVAPAPYFAGGKKATSTDSWGVAVSAKSKHPDAAKKFLRYLTINPTGNAESAGVVETIPTNKTAFEAYVKRADASAGAASANFGEILGYQLKNNAVHRPNVAGYSVFEPGANKMFSDVRNGADPKVAAARADKDIQAQIDRLK